MDGERFKQLFLPHCQRMHTVALRLTGNAQEAEDLVQDALLHLWTRRERLPQMADEGAFAATVVYRLFVSGRRRKTVGFADAEAANSSMESPFFANSAAAAPDEQLERKETAALIDQCLARLAPQQRDVFVLREHAGLSYDEIAAQTGLDPNNVGVLLSRARRQIRELLRKNL